MPSVAIGRFKKVKGRGRGVKDSSKRDHRSLKKTPSCCSLREGKKTILCFTLPFLLRRLVAKRKGPLPLPSPTKKAQSQQPGEKKA